MGENRRLIQNIEELSGVRETVAQYENKIAVLGQEIERLNEILRGRESDVGDFQRKYVSEI